MTSVSQSTEQSHETSAWLRNIVAFAREVRIELRDSQVIFASVIPSVESDAPEFLIRPWGCRLLMSLPFDQVSSARPVRHMVWETQKMISAAQHAGVFKGGLGR